MNQAAKHKLIVTGVGLLLCLPLCAAVAGLYCCFAPREYFATATVEFHRANAGDPQNDAELRQAFDAVPPPLRHATELQGVRNTGLFEIRSADPNPQTAADRANALAATLQQKFAAAARHPTPSTSSDETTAPNEAVAAMESKLRSPSIRIWERAKPAAHSSRPNMAATMSLGISIGLLLAGIGGTLLLAALLVKESHAQPLAPPIA